MIDFISGICRAKYDDTIVIDASGVGYGLKVCEGFNAKVQVGDNVEVWVFTKVREDSISLFGFEALVEKQVFEVLVTISGVGPKVGIAMLNTLSIDMILTAVSMEDAKIFATCSGVGKRLSEKILIELKPKLEKLKNITGGFNLASPVTGNSGLVFENEESSAIDKGLYDAAQSALVNLGFQESRVKKEIMAVLKSVDEIDETELIRKCLLSLNNVNSSTDHRSLF